MDIDKQQDHGHGLGHGHGHGYEHGQDMYILYVDYYIIGPALNRLTLLSEGDTAELAEVSVS